MNVLSRFVIQNPASNIYLTGFMASGKSTVGPRLAARLGYAFVDLDAVIEAAAGRSIPALFEEEGEAAFRRLEAEALQSVARRERVVVALGGGALVSAENRRLALRTGTVVYLRVTARELARRLQASPTERPLLYDADGQMRSGEALRAVIGALLAEREPLYRQAHLTVEGGGRSIKRTVEAVLRALERSEPPV